MKTYLKLAVIFATFAVFFVSCKTQDELKPVSPNPAVHTYNGIGAIKSIDREKAKLTIDHEDIKGYMSAMEMDFLVRDVTLLEKLGVGDKVEFQLERTGEKVVITKMSKIGEVASLKAPATYKTNCAECHGEKGEGAKKGISLIEGHALHHTEAENIDRVTNGKGKKMPAFKDKLSSEEIAEVVKFVRTEFQAKAKAEGKQDEKKDEKKGGHSHSH